MNPKRILLPIDITKCPLEVFSFVNGLVTDSSATVILLHVVTLNVLPMNGIYDDCCAEAEQHLKKLAGKFLGPALSARISVRVGKPAEEIVAAAKEENVDLIILPRYRGSFWERIFAFLAPQIVQNVIREAPCGVCLVKVKTRFNCAKEWIWAREVAVAANFVAGITEKKNCRAFVSKRLLPTHPLSQRHQL